MDELRKKLNADNHFERLSLCLDDPQDESKLLTYSVMIEDEGGSLAYDKVEGTIRRSDISDPSGWVDMGTFMLSREFRCPVTGYYSSI